MYEKFQSTTDYFYDAIPYIMEGQVVDVNDPDQMGRVRVWIPALDGENFNIENVPWAEYASPFMGFTVDYPAGGIPTAHDTDVAYGFWAIPKMGATVLVFCLNADPSSRFYFASTVRLHRNRSLPAGRNFDKNGKIGPFGDSGDNQGNLGNLEPAFSNLREQFQSKVDAPQAKTRGVYERQVAQPKFDKDGTEGYSKSPVDNYLDPQTYCWVTPGRNAIIMQDDPKHARLRIKTGEGHQVIFDDANERIYVSTSKGKTWLEMDQDGHIHIFAAESISLRSGNDVNIYADRDINMVADRNMNFKTITDEIRFESANDFHLRTNENIFITACGDMDLSVERRLRIESLDDAHIYSSQRSVFISAARNIEENAKSHMIMSSKRIDLNGPEARIAGLAACARGADDPPIIPGHEPWERPAPAVPRGPNWKP